MNTPIEIALIYGSTREGRFCDTVANWTANEIWTRNDFSLDLIDPAELDLPPCLGQNDHPALANLRRRQHGPKNCHLVGGT